MGRTAATGKMERDLQKGVRPNFLIIGAAKSGTTSLWHCLVQHPQVYMSPRKHTRFFAFDVEEPAFLGPPPRSKSVPYAVANPDDYHRLFAGVSDEIAVGEASHSYLYGPGAAARIRAYSPEMKLVAILRDPAERAFSHHRQMIRDGREPARDFLRALELEEARVRDGWWPDFHYARTGLYHAQLERYFHLFGRDRIRIYLYEDFAADPNAVVRDLFGFLGVDDAFVPEMAVRYNASGLPKNVLLHGSLKKLRRVRPVARRVLPEGVYRLLLRAGSGLHNRNLTKPALSQKERRVARGYFAEDVSRLERLIGRDLSGWLA